MMGCKGMLEWRDGGVTLLPLRPANIAANLWRPATHNSYKMGNWGDGEELHLRTEDEVNRRFFSGRVNFVEKADVTQLAPSSSEDLNL